MRHYFKNKWRLMAIFSFFFLLFFLYYNKTLFFQKSISSFLTIKSVPSVSLETALVGEKENYPLYLKIPVIGVNAQVEYVGLNSAGEMGVPKDSNNVAWFDLGPFPGEGGSAVIAGHFDDESGQEAVFFNLKNIKKDDKIFVENGKGYITTFVVRDIRVYDSEAFAPEIFNSIDGRHLNLITCMGPWSKAQNKYMQRLVIFADLE